MATVQMAPRSIKRRNGKENVLPLGGSLKKKRGNENLDTKRQTRLSVQKNESLQNVSLNSTVTSTNQSPVKFRPFRKSIKNDSFDLSYLSSIETDSITSCSSVVPQKPFKKLKRNINISLKDVEYVDSVIENSDVSEMSFTLRQVPFKKPNRKNELVQDVSYSDSITSGSSVVHQKPFKKLKRNKNISLNDVENVDSVMENSDVSEMSFTLRQVPFKKPNRKNELIQDVSYSSPLSENLQTADTTFATPHSRPFCARRRGREIANASFELSHISSTHSEKEESELHNSTHSEKEKSELDKSTHSEKEESEPDNSTHSEKEESELDKSTHSEKEESELHNSTHSEKEDSELRNSTHSEKEESELHNSTHLEKEKSELDKSTHSEKEESEPDNSTHSEKEESELDKSTHSEKEESEPDNSTHSEPEPIEDDQLRDVTIDKSHRFSTPQKFNDLTMDPSISLLDEDNIYSSQKNDATVLPAISMVPMDLQEQLRQRIENIVKLATESAEAKCKPYRGCPSPEKRTATKRREMPKRTRALPASERIKLFKPAPWANKRLYEFLAMKLKPHYGMRHMLEAENAVRIIYETVKKVEKNADFQKNAVISLKLGLATMRIIETTYDFYQFIRSFLPKVCENRMIPSVQPFTNHIWPPKYDIKKEWEKILD